jgi:hypothetical protein
MGLTAPVNPKRTIFVSSWPGHDPRWVCLAVRPTELKFVTRPNPLRVMLARIKKHCAGRDFVPLFSGRAWAGSFGTFQTCWTSLG